MKILREFYSPDDYEHVLVENKETGEKDVYVRGIFAQADTKNRNGRVYPKHIMEREVHKLQQYIAEGNVLLGELDHPSSPELKFSDSAIKITKLRMEGNNVLGEAKILKDTAKGKTAYYLAKENVKFATSTRGLGSLNESGIVQEDFQYFTNDLVSNPSVISCWLESIMESAEWIWDGSILKQDEAATIKQKIKQMPYSELKEGITKLFNDFISKL
jgi:hypothetical protein